MLLSGKRTLVFGAGGFVGRAVARAFAQEGAQVLLSGRWLATVEPVAAALRAAGGLAEAAEVDAGDEAATERYVARMAEAGGVEVVFNAIGLPAGEVAGFVKPSLEATAADLMEYANVVVRSQFITARAAARWMLPRRSGVIVFLTATPARGVAPLMVGPI